MSTAECSSVGDSDDTDGREPRVDYPVSVDCNVDPTGGGPTGGAAACTAGSGVLRMFVAIDGEAEEKVLI